MVKPGLRTPERLSLATDKVRFVGEPVVAVAAVSRAIAEDATELVEVNYEPLPVVVDAEKSLLPGAPLLYEDWGDNVIFHDVHKSPGTEEAFRNADYVFQERLVSNRYSPTPIENRAMLANFDKNQGTLSIFASTQFPHALRTFLSQTLDFPENKIPRSRAEGRWGLWNKVCRVSRRSNYGNPLDEVRAPRKVVRGS